MQRMQAKQGRNKPTSPEGTGQFPEDDKNQQGVHRVQERAGQVMAPRIETV